MRAGTYSSTPHSSYTALHRDIYRSRHRSNFESRIIPYFGLQLISLFDRPFGGRNRADPVPLEEYLPRKADKVSCLNVGDSYPTY